MLKFLSAGRSLMRRLAPTSRRPTQAPRYDAPVFDTELHPVAVPDENTAMSNAIAIVKDRMQRVGALAERQQASLTFLASVLEHVPAVIFVKDARDLRFVHINQAGAKFMGVPAGELLGRSAHDLMPAAEAAAVAGYDKAALRTGNRTVIEGVLYGGPGTERFGRTPRVGTATRVVIPGSDGNPQYLLVMIEDITDRRRAEQRIAFMAHYDTLTELPNRALFNDRLSEATQRAQGEGNQVAVMGLDLDRFKEVNDTLGHAAGDSLLRAVAGRLRHCVRDGDTVARIGGDEFAIVLASVSDPRIAEALAERMIESIRRPFEVDGHLLFVGLSIGIAFGRAGIDPADLVKRADMALYDAKTSGRGRYRCFALEMDSRMQNRRGLENDLRAAIGTEQFTLHYQPQVDLATGAIVGAEALMRWSRPGHGSVSPAIFIPLVEEFGLIEQLGGWLLEVACTEALLWPPHLHVAVNVSPVQFRLPGFLEMVNRVLGSSGLDASRLEVEVTEGVLLHDTLETLAILTELRACGVRLSLDDFGTGYSSLSYLQKFRFDKIKIDRSFVKRLGSGPNTSAIIQAVIGLSEALGMRTNAEGVEDEREAELLRGHGCREAQGYFFWRPMTAEAFRAVLAEARPAPLVPQLALPDLIIPTPKWPPDMPAEKAEEDAATPGSPVVAGYGRLLVVDDEQLMREMIAERLGEAGYAVLTAADGAMALALLDEGERIDAIITDLSMPGIDGMTVIRAAQERQPGLPAVLLTGYAGAGAVDATMTGAFSLLRKPVNEAALLGVLQVLLRERETVGVGE